MKRIILYSFALLLIVAAVASKAHAGPYDRESGNQAGYVNAKSSIADLSLTNRPTYIHAVTLRPTTSGALVLLYDHASAATGTPIVELGENATNDTRREVFNPPILATNGVYADVTNGAVVLEYR